MKNSILTWVIIAGIVIIILIGYNYQSNKNAVPLSEIFPEEKTTPADIEYEFVDETAKPVQAEPTTSEPAKIAQQQTAPQQTTTAPAKTAETTQPIKAQQPAATAITSKSTQEALKDIKSKEIPFTIQIASFKTKDAAQTSLNKVLEKGYQGFILSKNLGEKGTWHRVYVGIFKTKPEAEQVLTKLKQDYPSSFVITPK